MAQADNKAKIEISRKWKGNFSCDRSERKKWSTSEGRTFCSGKFTFDPRVQFEFQPVEPKWRAPLVSGFNRRLNLLPPVTAQVQTRLSKTKKAFLTLGIWPPTRSAAVCKHLDVYKGR